MEYLIINLLAISITAFIFYQLASSVLGISIRLKSLSLCVGCAVLISLVIPRIIVSFAGIFGTLVLLAILAITCAFLIAYYDEDAAEQSDVVEKTPENWALENNMQISAGIDVASKNDDCVNVEPAYEEMQESSLKQETFDTSDKQPVEVARTTSIDKTEGQLLTPSENLPVQQHVGELVPLVALDELMDYAFKQKEQQNMDQALYAFKKALNLYSETDTAPFLVIEIGGILKKRGAYNEAIEIFSEGRRIASQRDDQILEKEFIDIIAYLRIIKNALIENRLGYLSFDELPTHLLHQINTEYSDWKKLS